MAAAAVCPEGGAGGVGESPNGPLALAPLVLLLVVVNERANKLLASRFLRSSRVGFEDVCDTRSNSGAYPGVEAT